MKPEETKGYIYIEDLFFSYNPRQPLIRDMSFQVSPGEIFGFLGPSGAGKSTLQKILTGVLDRYTGKVVVNGQEVKGRNAHFYEEIGVDFEFPSLYGKFTALENLAFFGSLYQKELLRPGPFQRPTDENIILDQKKQGKTIILTTHNMHDAAEVCDRVAFIVDGQIRPWTPPPADHEKGGQQVTYRYLEDGQEQVGVMVTRLGGVQL